MDALALVDRRLRDASARRDASRLFLAAAGLHVARLAAHARAGLLARADALAAALVAEAAAAEAFPDANSGYRLSVRVRISGHVRFADVDATPDGTGTGWRISVACGVEEARTGRVLSRVTGRGTSSVGRSPGFGGSYRLGAGAGPPEAFAVSVIPGAPLAPRVQFTDARCPSGVGELSSGD